MTKEYETEQEKFWTTEFGNEYIDRNSNPTSRAYRTAVFSKVLSRTVGVQSIIEFGANIGQNLLAIRNLIPECSFNAIEINGKATEILKKIPNTTVHHGSIFDFSSKELGIYDLTFTSGVLIHINPEMLSEVYSRLYECSRRYILIMEYYNPTPIEVQYRGHSKRLFKRDFAGEILDRYSDLELIDYGFQYHRDYNFPCDDTNWFLMSKKV